MRSAEDSSESDDDLATLTHELRAALQPNLELVRPFGQGGMGTVFLARDPALKRNVVVKVLSPALAHDTSARRRFQREAEAAAAVTHPNVVSVFQVGDLPRSGTSYFVMQHVAGQTLADAFPTGTAVPEARAARIVGAIASALAAAHTRGLVHRDIKPSNVMVESDTERVIVLDFGISAAIKADTGQQDTKLTAEGSSIGTPQYMSPEQAAGEEVTAKSDVYSLGLVAYELLTGRPPFEADSPMALIAAHLKDAPTPIRDRRPDLDPHVATLVDQCLTKDPSERPSAEDVARALLPASTSVIEWPPPGLEPLRGRAYALLQGLFVFVILEFLYAGSTIFVLDAGDADAAAILLLGGLAITAYVVRVTHRTRHFPRAVRDARSAGYPRRVVWDVAIDSQPDTMALLNRVGEFASLSAVEVHRLMRRRRWAVTVTGGLLIAAMFSPLLGITGRPWDFDNVQLLVLLAAGISKWWFERPERIYRRRYVRREEVARRVSVSAGVVASWLSTSGHEVQGPHRRILLDRVLARTMTAAIAAVLLIGMLWFVNVMAITVSLSDDSPGDASQHVEHVLGARIDAQHRFPELQITRRPLELPSGDERVWSVLLRDSTRREATRLGRRVAATLEQWLAGDLESVDTAVLHEAVAFDAAAAWRSLGDPALPALWYQDALVAARTADNGEGPRSSRPVPISVACTCNRPLREVWRLADVHLGAGVLALTRSDLETAADVAAQAVAVGRNLLEDPITADAGREVLSRTVRFLDALIASREPRWDWLTEDAAVLTEHLEAFHRAAIPFLGKPAMKAFGSDFRLGGIGDSLLRLVADTTIAPVHRLGLTRAAVMGACYSGTELFWGFHRERRATIDTAFSLLADLPAADEYRGFYKGLSWDADTTWYGESGPVRRAIGTAVWVLPRLTHCNTLGLLDQDSITPPAQ